MLSPVQTSRSALVRRLAAHGDRVAVVGTNPLTYADLAGLVEREADRFPRRRGLVTLSITNSRAGLITYLAALAARQVVLMSPPQAADALASHYAADLMITQRAEEAPTWHWRVAPDEAGAGLAGADPVPEPHPDLALLLPTSGSTGAAKLVRLSHRNLVANARAIAGALDLRPDDVAVTTLPTHYCFGLSVLHSHLLVGAGLRLTNGSVVDSDFVDDLRRHRVTTVAGVPHTYDLLERARVDLADLPDLRLLTQAGGSLPAEKVRRWAQLADRAGASFRVMYGQTEATARIAVQADGMALASPATVGRVIPGHRVRLDRDDPTRPEEGELIFSGPSVMLGYAHDAADLALGRTVQELRTGDLARIDDGLITITGRRARFAKIFGLRLDLDRLERRLAENGVMAAVADGGDRLVIGVDDSARPSDSVVVADQVGRVSGLPTTAVTVVGGPLPRTSSGKVDYPRLVAASDQPSDVSRAIRAATVDDVTALLRATLGVEVVRPTDSFASLGGDSLSYVETSLRLEELLGRLPANWQATPIAALVDTPRARRLRWVRWMDTSVALRAAAIVSIVGSHANLFTLLGGAHLLLAVAGFNAARFQLTDVDRAVRARRLLRTAMRIAVPSVLVIAVVGAWTDGLGWRQALLLNGLSHREWSEPQWYYWFVEAIVYILLVTAALIAIPAVDRWERRHSFGVPFSLAVAALLTRYGVVGAVDNGDHIHRAHAPRAPLSAGCSPRSCWGPCPASSLKGSATPTSRPDSSC